MVLLKGQNNGDLFIRIFLTEKFKKNDYSELVFYNKQEEIFAAVHQRLGRAVIWNDTTDFIFKPPSMNHHGGEKSIFIKATEDREKFKEAVAKYKVLCLTNSFRLDQNHESHIYFV